MSPSRLSGFRQASIEGWLSIAVNDVYKTANGVSKRFS